MTGTNGIRNATLMLLAVGLMSTSLACAEQTITISDAESAGFEKDQQQMYQMIGAQDGWNGKWAGETVELYQFASESDVNQDVFASSVEEGNVSGWVEMCQHRNMLMLSKGEQACSELESL